MASYYDMVRALAAFHETDETTIINALSKSDIVDVEGAYNLMLEQQESVRGLSGLKTSNGKTIINGVKGTSQVSTSTAAGSVIDSNAGTAVKVATQVKTPINVTKTATGTINFNKDIARIGGQSVTGETFSFTTVGAALMAASVGVSLGKAIDSTLYNANPDFWDTQGMSSLNPDTWGSITQDIDENDPWYTRVGATAFNAILGIDNNNKTQMYVDENILAYLAGYMAQQGVFAQGEGGYTPPSDWQPTLDFDYPIKAIEIYNFSYNSTATTSYEVQVTSHNDPVYLIVGQRTNTNAINSYLFSKSSFTVTRNGSSQTVNTVTINNTPIYKCTASFSSAVGLNPFMDSLVNTVRGTGAAYYNQMGYIVLYGDYTAGGGGIDGITDQSGATVFNPSGISDYGNIEDVLAALKQQLPEIFDNAKGITQELIDEEGNSVQKNYYPIPVAEPNTQEKTQPTGGTATDYGTQQDPDIDPDTYPEGLLQTLVDIIFKSPVEDTNAPDTGSGDSPEVVPPTGSASALYSIYNPTQSQVDDFGAWLWSSDFVDQLKKLFNDPMESIISLHKIFGTPSTGGAQNIVVGYLDSGVSSLTVNNQYTSVDCGSVQLSEYFGNVYDYNNTAVELYLPFIGIVPLSVSDVMRGTLTVKYSIDVLTGACLAEVEVIRDAAGGVIYQYSGDCAVHYPVSSGSYIGIVGGLLSVAAGVGGTIASGGATAPLLLGAGASIMRTHTDVARSGGFSANSGAMGAKKPYLIISRPQTALPSNYLAYEGIGSNQTITLSQASGYVKIKDVQLNGISQATQEELAEIESLLKSGVII